MKYTDDQLLKMLQEHYEATGKVPTRTTFTLVHPNLIAYRFGSWGEALQLVGLEVQEGGGKEAKTNIRTCPQCNASFERRDWEDRQFCSVKCSNESRRHPDWAPKIPRDVWRAQLEEQKRFNLYEADFDTLGWDTKRKRVILEQEGKCGQCGIDEWYGVPISLEVDHIDGNNQNHERSNLKGLCPNCHSCTPTWRGRNVGRTNRGEVTDEELIDALRSCKNIRQALLKVGMVAKGANYRRAKLLVEVDR